MTRSVMILGVTVAALTLAACGETKLPRLDARRALGIDKNPPDQFSVVTRKPIDIPENLVALPAPELGARNPVERDAGEAVRAALGVREPAPVAPSAEEAALLAAIPTASQDVRAQIASEQGDLSERSYLLDEWIPGLRDLRRARSGEIIDPLEELEAAGYTAPERAAETFEATRPAGEIVTSAPVAAQAPAIQTPAPIVATPSATAPSIAAPSASGDVTDIYALPPAYLPD